LAWSLYVNAVADTCATRQAKRPQDINGSCILSVVGGCGFKAFREDSNHEFATAHTQLAELAKLDFQVRLKEIPLPSDP